KHRRSRHRYDLHGRILHETAVQPDYRAACCSIPTLVSFFSHTESLLFGIRSEAFQGANSTRRPLGETKLALEQSSKNIVSRVDDPSRSTDVLGRNGRRRSCSMTRLSR